MFDIGDGTDLDPEQYSGLACRLLDTNRLIDLLLQPLPQPVGVEAAGKCPDLDKHAGYLFAIGRLRP